MGGLHSHGLSVIDGQMALLNNALHQPFSILCFSVFFEIKLSSLIVLLNALSPLLA